MAKKKDTDPKQKVKVSLFVEPEVARAMKTQAARQGEDGVSKLVGKFFLCAHCNEAITDEFVVGIKAVAPGTFGVFFHANRPECRRAGGRK